MHPSITLVASLILALTATLSERKSDSAAATTMGEVGKRASYGTDGSWRTTASEDGDLIYTSLTADPGWTGTIVHSPSLPYSIRIGLHSGIAPAAGHAVGAGVIFAFKRADGAQGQSFYAALVAGGTLYVFANDGHFRQLVQSSGARSGREYDTLQVDVRRDGFSVSLNDNGSISQSVDGTLEGEYGVMVSGSGTANFRDLTVK